MNKSRHILLIPNEAIGPDMAGPSIRYWEFARTLSRYFTVVLAIPPLIQTQPDYIESETFTVQVCRTQAELKRLANQADVIITLGANLSLYPFLTQTNKPLVVDAYIPSILENLQRHVNQPPATRNLHHASHRGIHTQQLRAADFIICASERQKDFWLGWLAAQGRLNPYTHQDDPTMSRLIEVVPFGLPAHPPRHDKPVLKGIYKTIGVDDKVILWGGGIWDWLDWRNGIKAMHVVSQIIPEAKLFFMGTGNNNLVSTSRNAVPQAIALSKTLGLYDKNVFFNDWVPYMERHNYLLEADIGLNLHTNHIETRFAFRTRLLDYIWAGLPIVATAGDVMSDEVNRWNLGQVVQNDDVGQIIQTLLMLLRTPNLRQVYQPQFDQVRSRYMWETVMQPLINFCESPYQAADKPYLHQVPLLEPGQSSWQSLPGKVWYTAKRYGVRQLAMQMRDFLRWKLG
jgi:glycosyltransferase involved in cell wall biosynthesis